MSRRRTPSRYVRFLRSITAGALAPAAVVSFSVVSRPAAAALTAALAAAVLGPLEARVRFGFEDERRGPRARAVVIAYDALWMTALLSPLPTLAFALVSALGGRFDLVRVCALGLAASLALATYGVFVRRRWVRVRREPTPVRGLPAAFEGYRIAHLSDLHVGSIDRRAQAMSWVRRANALHPDLVVVTGDLLTTGTAYHDEAVEVVASLRATDGVYVCLGNHDYYAEDALCAKLERRGVRVLRNEGVVLRRGGDALFLAGVEDVWRGRPDLEAALRERPSRAPVVLLAHNPDAFPMAQRAGVALTLSGHTHAGQLAVPFLASHATLSHLVTRWPAGAFAEGPSRLFVHAGLGTTGPAIRLGAAPEVVELTLLGGLPRRG